MMGQPSSGLSISLTNLRWRVASSAGIDTLDLRTLSCNILVKGPRRLNLRIFFKYNGTYITVECIFPNSYMIIQPAEYEIGFESIVHGLDRT
jgi:hypothetical protein